MVWISKEELKEIITSVLTIPAIVEGKNDRNALLELGFLRVEVLDAALFEVVERFPQGGVVQILTDLDKEGKKLYGSLYSDLTCRGVKINTTLRDALFRTELSHIEGLRTYLENK